MKKKKFKEISTIFKITSNKNSKQIQQGQTNFVLQKIAMKKKTNSKQLIVEHDRHIIVTYYII